MRKIRIGFLLVISTSQCFCQEQTAPIKPTVPIPIEGMAGNNRFALQTLINRRFTSTSPINLLSVTSASASYDNNLAEFDFINTSQIGYDAYKGLGVSLGISMNAKMGFSPTAGIEYVYAKPAFLFVLAPGAHLSNSHNLEGLSVFEYKSQFKQSRGLYTRLQGLYNYNTKEHHHERSYFNVRIGPSFQHFAFGFGCNLDWYGPTKAFKDNYGVFLRYSFL